MSAITFESWDAAGIKPKNLNHEHKVLCPKCSEDRKHKNDKCLSVDPKKGLFNCHHCGWGGCIKSDFNTSFKSERKKDYATPPHNATELSDKTVSWFAGRGIGQTTLKKFKVSESVENGRSWINFNYYRNEQLINIKYRDGAKNFRMVGGAELIFYNLDSLKGKTLAFITEGEIDALTVWQLAPEYGIVSVPNGASKGNIKLEYLDNCWQQFEHLEKIVIATDSDEPGLALREELARRLGKERCFYIEYPEGCKDINEVYTQYDSFTAQETLLNIIPYPIEGVLTVSDIEEDIYDIYKNGYPQGEKIGFYNFDQLLSFRPGEVTIITGIPNSGKSEFTDEITARLAERSGWLFGVYSAENQPIAIHFAKISERYIGKKLYDINAKYVMDAEELTKAKVFVNNHYFFINVAEFNLSIAMLIEKAGVLVRSRGIKGFIIDPWNYLEHIIPKGYSETQYISQALTDLCNAAKRLKIHIFLVAHPTKLMKDRKTGKFEIPTLYQISGSAHFFNKADNGLCIYRDDETGLVTAYIQKVRFKWIGKKGQASFSYDWHNGRYEEQH